MLAVYKLLLDTGRSELPDDPSIGFQSGVYHLSTAPSISFHDCLDGNGFSAISQENMILKGGELSLVEDVKVKIVSKPILYHILQNDIWLPGCKASMLAEIGGTEKTLFEGMQVSAYVQTDEVSLEINLKDSTFANAGQLSLKVPQGFGNGSLETSYGSECLLKLYKREKSEVSISQGIRYGIPANQSPELEDSVFNKPVTTRFDERPAFARNFSVRMILNADTGQPAQISVAGVPREPELSGTEGHCIEIVSGVGKGDIYRITEVVDEDTIILDRPVKSGDIKGGMFWRSVHTIFEPYNTFSSENKVIQAFDLSQEGPQSADNVSIFRFVRGQGCECAVPTMENISLLPYPQEFHERYNPDNPHTEKASNAKIISDDGSSIDVKLKINMIEKRDGYSIIEFPDAAAGKISVVKEGRHQPRWRKNYGYSSYYPANISPTASSSFFPKEGEEIPKKLTLVAETPNNTHRFTGLHITLYWRIDDLQFDGKYTIVPIFSFQSRAYSKLKLRAFLVDDGGFTTEIREHEETDRLPGTVKIEVRGQAGSSGMSLSDPSQNKQMEKLAARLRNLLTFDSETEAKYIYLQLFFFDSNNIPSLNFSALPAECQQEVDIGKVLIKGHSGSLLDWLQKPLGIATTAWQLCDSYGISADKDNFDSVNKKIVARADAGERESTSSIPFKHGEKFNDKLAEACRAANFSIISSGSKLHARDFLSGEPEWTVTPADVMKGSLEVRGLDFGSVATEWDFSANVQGVQKTLSMEMFDEFPGSEAAADGDPFSARLIYPEYIWKWEQGFGARIDDLHKGRMRIGGKYRINDCDEFSVECELTSIRIDGNGADVLFVIERFILPKMTGLSEGKLIEITPLKHEADWREIVCGTLDISYGQAKRLWEISRKGFERTRRRAKLDERYSKHQVAAFGSDRLWVENFIHSAEHNSFAKTIISFKVPLDRLPFESLHNILLRRITLAFGRFRNNHLDGWIAGYSLIPSENVIQIEFINSKPVEPILWLNENLTEDKKTIDEMEPAQEFYSED